MQKTKTRKLRFNFRRIHKKDVYQAFLEIYARGGVEMDNQELISFLAHYTNLGSEASIKTLFYRYKQQIHL
jgi:DNA polymerase III gamma/tau subunit